MALVRSVDGLPNDPLGDLMTTTHRWFGLGLALLLGACGGSSAPRENSAAGTPFVYGSSLAATPDQAGAMAATFTSIDAFRATPGTGSGLGAADGGSVTGALLQGGSIASFSPAELGATSSAAFDVPACAVVTSGKVTFTGCRVTVAQSSGGATTNGAVTVNGDVSLSADHRTLTWDLTYGIGLDMSGTSALTMSGALHSAGNVVATATTAVGAITSEVALTVSASGQTLSAGVDESLAFDVTRSDTCASGGTGGTLEAKRVWTARPAGVPPAQLPDEAAKVQWTGCGTATVQVGAR
jgi:hypothetical protein